MIIKAWRQKYRLTMRDKNHWPPRPATISPEKVSPKKRWLQDMSKFDQNENDLAEIINVHEEQGHRNIEMESSKKPPRKEYPVTTSVGKKSKSVNSEDIIITEKLSTIKESIVLQKPTDEPEKADSPKLLDKSKSLNSYKKSGRNAKRKLEISKNFKCYIFQRSSNEWKSLARNKKVLQTRNSFEFYINNNPVTVS